jgi:hypothetical protein
MTLQDLGYLKLMILEDILYLRNDEDVFEKQY